MPYIFTGDVDYEKTLEGWLESLGWGELSMPWTAAHNVEEQVIIFPQDFEK